MALPNKRVKTETDCQAVVQAAPNGLGAQELHRLLPVISNIQKNMNITDLVKRAPLLSDPWKALYGASCRSQTRLALFVNQEAEVAEINEKAEKLCTTAVRDPRTFLRVASLSRTSVLEMTRLFPNITELVVKEEVPAIPSFYNLIYLLQQWSSKLVALHLKFHGPYQANTRKVRNFLALFRVINSLPNLERLKYLATRL